MRSGAVAERRAAAARTASRASPRWGPGGRAARATPVAVETPARCGDVDRAAGARMPGRQSATRASWSDALDRLSEQRVDTASQPGPPFLKALYTRRHTDVDKERHDDPAAHRRGRDRRRHGGAGALRRLPLRPDPLRPAAAARSGYAAVVDANEAIAADAAARYGYERHGTDWRELLDADDVAGRQRRRRQPPAPRDRRGAARRRQARAVREAARRDAVADAQAMVAPPRPHPDLRHRGRRSSSAASRPSPRSASWCDGELGEVLALQRPLLVRLRPRAPQTPMSLALQGRPGHRARSPTSAATSIDLAEFVCGPMTPVRRRRRSPPRSTERALAARARPRPRGGRAQRRHASRSRTRTSPPSRRTSPPAPSARFSISRVALGPRQLARPSTCSPRRRRQVGHGPAGRVLGHPTAARRRTRRLRTRCSSARRTPTSRAACRWTSPASVTAQSDLFGFQARAFLEQVAGIEGGLPPVADLRATAARPAASRRRHPIRRRRRRRSSTSRPTTPPDPSTPPTSQQGARP